MVRGMPWRCISTSGASRSAANASMSGESRPAEVSLIQSAPASRAASATASDVVSMLRMGGASMVASRIDLITSTTRRCCSRTETGSAPGRVDSPPTSMMSAPSRSISRARPTAASRAIWRPPSEKLSGVTLRMPMIRGPGRNAKVIGARTASARRPPLAAHGQPLKAVAVAAGQQPDRAAATATVVRECGIEQIAALPRAQRPVRQRRGLDQYQPTSADAPGEDGGKAVGGDVPTAGDVGIVEQFRGRKPDRCGPAALGRAKLAGVHDRHQVRTQSAQQVCGLLHGEDGHAMSGAVVEAPTRLRCAHAIGKAAAARTDDERHAAGGQGIDPGFQRAGGLKAAAELNHPGRQAVRAPAAAAWPRPCRRSPDTRRRRPSRRRCRHRPSSGSRRRC